MWAREQMERENLDALDELGFILVVVAASAGVGCTGNCTKTWVWSGEHRPSVPLCMTTDDPVMATDSLQTVAVGNETWFALHEAPHGQPFLWSARFMPRHPWQGMVAVLVRYKPHRVAAGTEPETLRVDYAPNTYLANALNLAIGDGWTGKFTIAPLKRRSGTVTVESDRCIMIVETSVAEYQFDYIDSKPGTEKLRDLDDDNTAAMRRAFVARDSRKLASTLIPTFAAAFLANTELLAEVREARLASLEAYVDGTQIALIPPASKLQGRTGIDGERLGCNSADLAIPQGAHVWLGLSVESRRVSYYVNRWEAMAFTPEPLPSAAVLDRQPSHGCVVGPRYGNDVVGDACGVVLVDLGVVNSDSEIAFRIKPRQAAARPTVPGHIYGHVLIRTNVAEPQRATGDDICLVAPPLDATWPEVRTTVLADILASYDVHSESFRATGFASTSSAGLYEQIVLDKAVDTAAETTAAQLIRVTRPPAHERYWAVSMDPLAFDWGVFSPNRNSQGRLQNSRTSTGRWSAGDPQQALATVRYDNKPEDTSDEAWDLAQLLRLREDLAANIDPKVAEQQLGWSSMEVGHRGDATPHAWACLAMAKAHELSADVSYLDQAVRQAQHLVDEHLDGEHGLPALVVGTYGSTARGSGCSSAEIARFLLVGACFDRMDKATHDSRWRQRYEPIREGMFSYLQQRRRVSDMPGDGRGCYQDSLTLRDRVAILHFFMPTFYPLWNARSGDAGW